VKTSFKNNRTPLSIKILLIIFLSAHIANAQNCSEGYSDFSFEQLTCSPKTVRFFNSSINVQSYFWDLGNGQTSTLASPQVNYADFGLYTVTLTITYSSGCVDRITKNIPLKVEGESLIVNQDTSICVGDNFLLVRRNQDADFCWSPSNSLEVTSSGNAIAKPIQTTTYFYTSKILDGNLITNGNFSDGNTGFGSEYEFNPIVGYDEGVYTVNSNPKLWHPQFYSCGDHTSGNGNMMVVNGARELNRKVWYETVHVTPNTNYMFSTWLQTVNPDINTATLQFSINDQMVGPKFKANSKTCKWEEFHSLWNSGNNDSARIVIVNMNDIASGNDFALDDIFFGEVHLKIDSVQVAIKSAIRKDITVSVCSGQSYFLPSGKKVEAEGRYTDTLVTANCDTLITGLTLTTRKTIF
jgi:PKD repeat protein